MSSGEGSRRWQLPRTRLGKIFKNITRRREEGGGGKKYSSSKFVWWTGIQPTSHQFLYLNINIYNSIFDILFHLLRVAGGLAARLASGSPARAARKGERWRCCRRLQEGSCSSSPASSPW